MRSTDDALARSLVELIRVGDVDGLTHLLAANPGLAGDRFGSDDQSCTALHFATDWPGHFPEVARTIEVLVAAGAPIDFLGVEIGSVRAVTLQYDGQRQRFPVQVMAEIYPLRLGAVRTAFANKGLEESQADVALLQRLVNSGLRAQARTGNLLTGQLFVALDFDPKAKPVRTPLKLADGVVTLPTVAGTLSELQPQVAEIVQKLSKVPFDDIGRNLASTLRQADASLTQLTPEVHKAMSEIQRTLSTAQAALAQLTPEAQKALTEVQRTLSTAQGSLERLDRNLIDPSGPMNRNLDQTLVEFQRAAQSLRVLSDFLQRHPEALLRGNPADRALPSNTK